jgi:hypothetical protein
MLINGLSKAVEIAPRNIDRLHTITFFEGNDYFFYPATDSARHLRLMCFGEGYCFRTFLIFGQKPKSIER